MSFSSEIKKELCNVKGLSGQQAAAMLYGIMFSARKENARPVIITESTELTSAAAELIRMVFPQVRCSVVRQVKNSGSLFTLKIKSGYERIESRFGDFESISGSAADGGDEVSGAFLRGVFISCGSVTDPHKEYHLEIVLPDRQRSGELLKFISEHGMAVKETHRGSAKRSVIYAKESGVIEDFLTYIGAANHSLEIMQVKIEKDVRNRVNRSVNCENANLDRTVNAAGKSIEDIKLVCEKIGEGSLSPELRETARLRLENPELSLSELCGMFSQPISRSGLNHRLKKLSAMAEELKQKTS